MTVFWAIVRVVSWLWLFSVAVTYASQSHRYAVNRNAKHPWLSFLLALGTTIVALYNVGGL